MRKLTTMLVIVLVAFAVGATSGQAAPAAKPVLDQIVVAAKPDAVPEAPLKIITGEVVSVDKDARRMTVRYAGWFTSKEADFAVAEPVVPVLAEIRPGERITVGYTEAQGQLIAKTISKLPAERGTEK